MNTRLEFLIRKNKGRELLPLYITELKRLTENFEEESILSLEITDSQKTSVKPFKKNKNITSIPFSNKEVLKDVIKSIYKKYNGKTFISTGYSEYCGFGILNSIKDFNIKFEFGDEKSGLILLYSVDMSNRLIIDFYEENGMELYDLEIYGDLWIE